jgi:putative NADPH-quinone reductase
MHNDFKGAPQGQDFKERVHHITYSTFRYIGMDVINYKAFFGVMSSTDDQRKAWLKEVGDYVSKLDT